jgi:HD-like signal output (HDOD) protein
MKDKVHTADAGVHPRGEKLPERTLIALCNMGRVLKLKPGDTLLPMAGDAPPAVYLVVRGLLRVYHEGERPFSERTVFNDADWISPRIIESELPSGCCVAAEEASQILVLPESILKTLEAPLFNFILRRVSETYVSRLRELEREIDHAAVVNGHLSHYIQEARTQRCAGYEESELVLNLLRNLPRLPAYTTQLIQMLQQENAPHREVARLVKDDPSLVSEILKTVNSSYYGLQKKISDLNYAVLYLGFHQIHQLLISNGLRKVMPNTEEFQQLHQHSMGISHLAHEICQFNERQKASLLSTIALLHDIGKSVILLLRSQNPKLAFFINMLDAAKIGAMLLKDWGIPPMVYECIELQDLPEFVPPSLMKTPHREDVAVLHVAHVAWRTLQGETDAPRGPFVEELREILQLPGDSFEDFLEGFLLRGLKGKLHTLPHHVRSIVEAAESQA